MIKIFVYIEKYFSFRPVEAAQTDNRRCGDTGNQLLLCSWWFTIYYGHCESLTESFTGPYHDRQESALWWKPKWHKTGRSLLGNQKYAQSHERQRRRMKSNMTNLLKWLHCICLLDLLWQRTFNLTSLWSLHDIEHRKDRTGYMYRVFV